jgi:hypothetical protein
MDIYIYIYIYIYQQVSYNELIRAKMEAYNSVMKEVLRNILTQFVIPRHLGMLIKACLN